MSGPLKCVILGGGGFIGSHAVDGLLERGHHVRVFERENAGSRNIAQALGRIDLVRGDFLDGDDLCRAMDGMDVAVHLVSTTLPKSSNEDMAYDIDTNVIGTIRMLDAAKRAGVRKIIFASSGGTIYGLPQSLPVAEDHPTSPICSHGIGKLAAEKYLHLYHHLHGLDYTVLRFANPYGERQDPMSGQGAVTAFLWRCMRGQSISIWGDGTVARDFFHVGDLVRAILAVTEKDVPSKIYNIGSGMPHTLNEVLDIMRTVTGRVPDVRYLPAREFDVPVNFLDISRARRELLWQPRTSLNEGMARTWECLRRHCGTDRE